MQPVEVEVLHRSHEQLMLGVGAGAVGLDVISRALATPMARVMRE